MLNTLRSLPTADAVAKLVSSAYDVDVLDCELIRSLVNEVYEIRAVGGRYVLKLYRHGRRTDEVGWEQDVAAQLRTAGLGVAAPVPLADGRLAGEVDAPEGRRPFALTAYVDGTKPSPPFSDELYVEFGRLAATYHRVGETVRSDYPRRAFGLDRLLDEPLARAVEAMAGQPERRAVLVDLVAATRERIDGRSERLDWGLCHGDLSLDNVHRVGGVLTLHDFDLAGPGWRIGDLAGACSTPHREAFLAGYAERRDLPHADLEVLAWWETVDLVNGLAFHLDDKPGWRGRESLTEGWADPLLDRIVSLAEELGVSR